jgi:hypothetical protein
LPEGGSLLDSSERGHTNQDLNTIISAAGVRKPTGDLVDDFDDPMGTGVLTELIA